MLVKKDGSMAINKITGADDKPLKISHDQAIRLLRQEVFAKNSALALKVYIHDKDGRPITEKSFEKNTGAKITLKEWLKAWFKIFYPSRKKSNAITKTLREENRKTLKRFK